MATVKIQGELERQRGVYYVLDPEQTPLGVGGMGKVYAATSVNEQTGERRPVAVKFMYEDLPAEALERTRREASIQLKNDNLIEMLGFSETTDRLPDGRMIKHYHVASELLDGITLADLLDGKLTDVDGKTMEFAQHLYDKYRNTPDAFAVDIVKNVLAGVLALHNAGYIHRDIDPSNIMCTSDGHIKLIDFGIAKKLQQLSTTDSSHTVSGQFMGKPEYASPELVLGDVHSQNQTTDIYAIGILLFQCITGYVPFRGPRHEVLEMQRHEELPLKDIDNRPLREVIRKATEKRQAKRYQSAAEMLVALEKFRDEADSQSPYSRTQNSEQDNAVATLYTNVGTSMGGNSRSESDRPIRSSHGSSSGLTYIPDSDEVENAGWIIGGVAAVGLVLGIIIGWFI